MLEYDFMVNAFAASGIAAILAGIVGYFLVMRGQTFAGHALSHIGFAGATGSALIGLDPLWGMLGFTLVAGVGIGTLSERISTRDVAIGVVLSLALGLGLLFLHYSLYGLCRRSGDRAPVRQCPRGRTIHHCRPGQHSGRNIDCTGGHHAPIGLRQSAARIGRGQGCTAALRFDRISGDRRDRRIGRPGSHVPPFHRPRGWPVPDRAGPSRPPRPRPAQRSRRPRAVDLRRRGHEPTGPPARSAHTSRTP